MTTRSIASRSHARGATHLLVPASEKHWFHDGKELRDFLARRAAIVATNAAGTLWALTSAPAPGEAKVFVIGLGKTGTTSVNVALDQLGFPGFHWGGGAAYRAVLWAQRDGERLLHHIGESYAAYDDIETLSVRFDLADLQYPNSRFILTVRDEEQWVASRHRHAERNVRKEREGRYTGMNFRTDEASWRAQLARHHERVTSWFAGRDELLVLDVCGGEGWERLAPFLGRPVPSTPFPVENVGRDRDR